MLVASRLVFVHVPRTGGWFIRRALGHHLELDPTAPKLPAHASYDELPAEFRNRPAFCVVRNPWDWYVSWYHYVLAQGPHLAALGPANPKRLNWEGLFSSGHSTFGEVVASACEGRLEGPFAAAARERDTDIYSEYVRGLTDRGVAGGALEIGRFEELIPFLVRFFDRRDVLTEPLRNHLEHTPPVNASERGPYRDYYDDELRELVAHKARSLIQRFGYVF
jgi:hypothetical protein